MRNIFLIILVSLGCTHTNKMSSEQELNKTLKIKLEYIKFDLNHYALTKEGKGKEWYYPYQMLFAFSVVNNSDKPIWFGARDYVYNSNDSIYGKIFSVYKGNEYSIGANSRFNVTPNNQEIFFGFNTDLPIFKHVYSSSEFNRFLEDYIKKSFFVYNPILEDYYTLSQDTIYSSIYSKPMKIDTDSVNFIFYHYKNNSIDISNIGYPNEHIPETINIVKPIPGIEY